jgi:hypothetical protein
VEGSTHRATTASASGTNTRDRGRLHCVVFERR